MMSKVEEIKNDAGELYAMVVRQHQCEPGINFFTQDESSLQLGRQRRETGTTIKPHRHKQVAVERKDYLQEVLFIEEGRIRVNFYGDDNQKFSEVELGVGDMILLIKGGHGFDILEEVQMTEIKQGPYNPASKEMVQIGEEA